SNGQLPIGNAYINNTNSDIKFAEQIDYSDNRYRAYMQPLRWTSFARRKCNIAVEWTIGLFNRQKKSLRFKGALFRGSPSVYPNSLENKKIGYFSFGDKKADYEDLKKEGVALIKKGSTSYAFQMWFAGTAQASAVLIYDEQIDQDSILFHTVLDEKSVFSRGSYEYKTALPFIGMSKENGETLKKLIEEENPTVSIECEF
ncbi:MAG: PA domain-containing protein, partial [Bdellovibrio sp.]